MFSFKGLLLDMFQLLDSLSIPVVIQVVPAAGLGQDESTENEETEDDGIVCVCGKRFACTSTYLRHLSLSHLRHAIQEAFPVSFESMVCEMCTRQFSSFQGLLAHLGGPHEMAILLA